MPRIRFVYADGFRWRSFERFRYGPCEVWRFGRQVLEYRPRYTPTPYHPQ